MADRQRLPEAAEDHLLMGDEARVAARCGSAGARARRPPRSARPCASRCRTGASSLPSWCSSMISHSGMCGAISFAASIISTAPIAKLGAMKQLARAHRRSQLRRTSGARSCPPRSARPLRGTARAFSKHGVGLREVDDHVRRPRARPERCCSSSGSARPTSSMSSAPSTACAHGLPHPPGGARHGDADHGRLCGQQRGIDRRERTAEDALVAADRRPPTAARRVQVARERRQVVAG